MRALCSSIRSRLVLLVLVALVPMLLFSAVLLQRAYRVSAGLVEESTLSTARRVAVAVDAQVARAEAVGSVIAELPARQIADLAQFEEAAMQVLTAAGLDGELVLIGPDGNIVADTLRSGAGPLGQGDDQATSRRVFETGKPQVSGVFVGHLAHEKQVAIHVPVIQGGVVRYDAAVVLPARLIVANLVLRTLPDHWFTLIVDATGEIVHAGPGATEAIGDPIPAPIRSLFAREEGFGSASALNNEVILLGFTRSPRTQWTAAVGVPARVVRGPLLLSIGALATGGAAIFATSLGLAWVIGRNISRPLDALAREAARLGRNELPDTQAAWGLAEADATARALYEAGLQLRNRDAERDTALRRAETSEQRLLLAQEVGEIGTWEIDLVNGERTWSPQQFNLYGLPPDHGVPQNRDLLALIHPEDRAYVASTMVRAAAAPTSYTHVFRVVHPGGQTRWLRTAARSEFENGRPVRAIGISIDVTERQEAERMLRESANRLEAEVAARIHQLAASEERFRSYFDYSSDALAIVRVEQDRFVYEAINPAGERLLGLTRADIAGRTLAEVLEPETAAAALAGLKATVAKRQPITLERTLALPSGVLHLETVLVPVQGLAGEGVVRIIGANRDLTERRRIESRLAHAQRLEAVGQLTGGVAHDFNNLLTVVIGNLALLRKRLGNDESNIRYIASVEAAAERGARLTASLLAFSRRQSLVVEPIDIGARIQDSVTLLRRALGEQIEFALDVAPILPLANADSAQLEAAVLNLVINARDAMDDADARKSRTAAVRITVREAMLLASDLEGNEEAKPGRFVAVEVSDNGSGMPPSVRARAFEPFFTTKEVGRGTGLGLSQVFGFVRQLGGHVGLDSMPGQGTQIVMYLPAAKPVFSAAPTVPAEPSPMPAGATVLVVEDDTSIRETTAEVLRDAGLVVLTAADGSTALETLRGASVDLLFSDIVMPGGSNGVELARQAHGLRPQMAILLTSGYAGEALSRYGGEAEYELLAKPYTRAELLARIGRVLATVT